MKKDQKVQIVEEYVGIFEKPGIYLMDFTGLNVAEITDLRRKLRESSVSMRVVKNTLAKRALKQLGNDSLDKYLVGPIGVAYSAEDAAAPAKILLDFRKNHDKMTIKIGYVDGRVVDEKAIDAISKLPSKLELQAKLAYVLNAPIVKLARTLNAAPVKLALTIKALEEKKSKEES